MLKKLIVILAIVVFGIIGLSYWSAPEVPTKAEAIMCFKSGERISGGLKICYYSCGGGEAAITVESYQLCPLSINR